MKELTALLFVITAGLARTDFIMVLQTVMATQLQLSREADKMSLQNAQGALVSRKMSARDALSQISHREGVSSLSRQHVDGIPVGITQTSPSGLMAQFRLSFEEVRRQCDETLVKITEASDACVNEGEVCYITEEATEGAR